MKRLSVILLILSLLAAAILSSALADDDVSTYYVVTANGKGLNMRSAMVSPADNVIRQIPYGAKVTVWCFLENNYWAQVEYQGSVGYVMSRYLSKVKPGGGSGDDPAVAADLKSLFKNFQPVMYNAMVVPATPSGFVNIRWAPSTSAPVEAICYGNTELLVIAENSKWAQVIDQAQGKCGFMMKQFLR